MRPLQPLLSALRSKGQHVTARRQFTSAAKLYNAGPSQGVVGREALKRRRHDDDSIATLDPLLRRHLFYTPAFQAYGGVSGLYDLGPPGCALQANIIQAWRRHFVLEENMLEMDCTVLTPEAVLKTSGHVDKFADWISKDPETGESFRTDHLIKKALEKRLKDGDRRAAKSLAGHTAMPSRGRLSASLKQEYEEILARIDNYDGHELHELMVRHRIRSPGTKGQLLPPSPFSLIFQTSVGPASSAVSYLRPETAQGQFLNFRQLWEFNQHAMPFASASIGKAFRNEISPKAGLLRVREFMMAEIEHYMDPEGDKKHQRFEDVSSVSVSLLSRGQQMSGHTEVQSTTIRDAVSSCTIGSETLGYFVARTQQFLIKMGADPSKIRFRQHVPKEMAHYAAECWDAELLTSHGWIECVGLADRRAFDLELHQNRSGVSMSVTETRVEPKVTEQWVYELVKSNFGPKFRKDGIAIVAELDSLSQESLESFSKQMVQAGKIEIGIPTLGRQVELDGDIINIEKRTRTDWTREYIPNVIEPAFGIGRIMFSILEHIYWLRESDAQRGVLSFPPSIAPTKVSIISLYNNRPELNAIVTDVRNRLQKLGIPNRVDIGSASIGKRYIKSDEMGTPLAITVDFQSKEDGTITLRERDTTTQVRADVPTICTAMQSFLAEEKTWAELQRDLPAFLGQDSG